uniref:Lysozyme n=1 Tax=Panagrolaimus superbus TaxID=310955 RepID=A0A914ZAL9_9BILA
MKLLTFTCFIAFWSLSEGSLGWDGIQAVDVAGFKCLAENGFSFYIARVWRSIGSADPTGIQNIKNARKAGWKYVDGYIFPCFKKSCGSAKYQMDIEIQEWPADKSANQAFITDMVQQAEAMGTIIVGTDWKEVADKPLWYAHWDEQQNFDGFKAFGGWTKPAIHQFEGDVKGPCGVSMDKNWYP